MRCKLRARPQLQEDSNMHLLNHSEVHLHHNSKLRNLDDGVLQSDLEVHRMALLSHFKGTKKSNREARVRPRSV